MKSSVIFLLIFLFRTESVKVEDVIETCLIKILRKYFPNQSVLLITNLAMSYRPSRSSLFPNLEKEYDSQVIGRIMEKSKWTLLVYNTEKYVGLPPRVKLNNQPRNCLLFIRTEIMTSDILFEWEMDRLQENPLWNPTGRTLIILKAEKGLNDSADLARRVIEKVWTKSRAVNNLVMVAEESGILRFYTWFPYKQPDCSKVRRVVHLDNFSKGRFQWKTHLFPAKIQNDLQNCELVAATDTCIPYVFAEENNSSKFVDGLEIKIINTFSKILNFKITTVRPRNMWTTSVNKSLKGAFKLLVKQKVDLAFSCLMLNQERFLLALALPSYYEDSLVWFVPSPTYRLHTADIFYAFPEHFWLLMLSVMAMATSLIIALSYAEHELSDWGFLVVIGNLIKLVGVSVHAPVEIPAKKYSLVTRLFVFVFFLYSMHITIAFQSSLFSLYRQSQYSQFYSSLKQAVDAGLFVYLRSSNRQLYNQSDHALWNKILQPGRFDYLKDFGEVFSKIAYEKNAVALFIKTTGVYMISVYFTDEYGSPQIYWLSQKFSTYPVTMYLSPGNPLFETFENQVYRLLASGLIRRWLTKLDLGAELYLSKKSYKNSPLTMRHMEGAFLLLLLLLGTAILNFLLENIVHYVVKKLKEKKPIRRHFFLPKKLKSPKSNAVAAVGAGQESQTFLQ